MSEIVLLPKETIDLIAAGEVAERPSSVVKELIENSIDAGATSVAVEIKDGGLKLIRVSDNGSGMDKNSLPLAFTAHATSKIRSIEDLDKLSTFGFRGEALSSISAVSKCEVITKTCENIVGYRYELEGGKEKSLQEVGAPNGTTFLIRDIFFNTPARLKFLKSGNVEGSYVTEVVENAALSHPEVAFSYINNGRNVLNTSGKGQLSECIYRVYGKDAYNSIIEIDKTDANISLRGYFAKPEYFKSSRSFEKFFVNSRPVKSNVLRNALEEAYSPYLMNHQFPFAVIFVDIDPSLVDVNVHPSKAEVRFDDEKLIYDFVFNAIRDSLSFKEMLPSLIIHDEEAVDYETTDMDNACQQIIAMGEDILPSNPVQKTHENERYAQPFETKRFVREEAIYEAQEEKVINPKQLDLFEEKLLSKNNKDEYHIVGQIFDTYWIVQYKDTCMFIDQHAAHEKVLFERYYKQISMNNVVSQLCSPSIIVTLSGREEAVLIENMDSFREVGFDIEHFGGREYAIKAVPETLKNITSAEMFSELIMEFSMDTSKKITQSVYDRIATMACKAAVKGNMHISEIEAKALINELLELENPYHCPHGRPTIITMTKDDIEKRFKRII